MPGRPERSVVRPPSRSSGTPASTRSAATLVSRGTRQYWYRSQTPRTADFGPLPSGFVA